MENDLINILRSFKNKKVLIWGDFILDEYIYTSTGRVSREAPVLVTELDSNEYKLGGAGNVVFNISALGAIPIPLGFIGKDADGRILKNNLSANNIITDYLIEIEDFTTPKKSRILAGGEHTKKQQILRIDKLNKSIIKDYNYARIFKSLKLLVKETDILIISDYIYTSVKPDLLEGIKNELKSKLIIVDSRYNLKNFKNISYATPNEPEIKRIFPEKSFLSEDDFYYAGQELLKHINAQGIILKRGHKGMVLFEKKNQPQLLKIHGSQDIVDGTGAGDTVISVLSLALANGADLFSAAKLATIAAGIVVMKDGAYPISDKELFNELQ